MVLTPEEIENHTLSQFMHGVNNVFSHQFNQRHGRTGTVWNGRHHAGGWVSRRQWLVLLILLWYVEGNSARRRHRPVPARDWKWCSAYYLLQGRPTPIPTTLDRHLARLYGAACRDPVAQFEHLLTQAKPDWWRQARRAPFLRLDRDQTRTVRHDFRGLAHKIRQQHLRSWKLEVEYYSMLLQPKLALIV